MQEGLLGAVQTVKDILSYRELRRFLGAYFLYEDAVNTVVFFSSIFAAKTLGFEMAQLITLYILIQVTALIGAFLWGWPTDRLGAEVLVVCLLARAVGVGFAAGFVPTPG